MYYLWSTSLHGWFSRSSTYTTDFTEAKQYSREDALAMVQKFKKEAGYGLLPIADADLTGV